MSKYEIYQVGKLPPLTIVESDNFRIDVVTSVITFYNDEAEGPVATFNWNNIAGFKQIIEEPDTVPEVAQNG